MRVPWGSDERVKSRALGGGSPRPEEEGRPDVGRNLGGWWGCLDPHMVSGSPALQPRLRGCVTLGKFHALFEPRFPPQRNGGQTHPPRKDNAKLGPGATRGGLESLASQFCRAQAGVLAMAV